MSMLRSNALAAVAAAVLAACQAQAPLGGPKVRLVPVTMSGGPQLLALVDRDTTSGVAITGSVAATLGFSRPLGPTAVKVYADADVKVRALGARAVTTEDGWTQLDLEGTASVAELQVVFESASSSARVYEVEIWGRGQTRAGSDLDAVAALTRPGAENLPDTVRVYRADAAALVLAPAGLREGTACAQATVRVDAQVALPSSRRALLAYEAEGVQRSVVLARSLNGGEPVGGWWLGGGNRERTVADEVDPRLLTEHTAVTLCLPQTATAPVTVRDLRLVLVLDDGTSLLDRESEAVLAAAVDGRLETAETIAAGTANLAFERPVALGRAAIHFDLAPSRAAGRMHAQGQWFSLPSSEWRRGENLLPTQPIAVDALELTVEGSARPDLPAASIAEVVLAGSPVGPRALGAALALTYPRSSMRGGEWHVERFGDKAYVAGWAQSPEGPGVVELDGVRISGADGQFGTELRRPAGGDAAWRATVLARFPDGTTRTRVLVFDEDREAELLSERSAASIAVDDARRFGREGETAWGKLKKAEGARVTLGTDVAFEAPPGAVDVDLSVGISRKGKDALPPLDPGMVNVTAPTAGGYRFMPPGQVFKQAATITLPYEPSYLPEGMPDEEVRTYYYDRKLARWFPLKLKQVRRDSRQVLSETTHFTFMVNAVLVAPDHPGPASFNPTSLKDIALADPSAGIDFIEPPEGNNHGTSRVAFPLRLPRARGAYQPQLSIAYDSSGGNGWVGVGWDLAVPSIAIDTKYGAPNQGGRDRYSFAGEQLVKGLTSDDCERGEGTRFHPRVEGAFRRILKCDDAGLDSHWEVTEKDGTLYVFGAKDDSRLRAPPRLPTPEVQNPLPGEIGQWLLERVIDANGNLTVYTYAADDSDGDGEFTAPGHAEPFTYRYLSGIVYTGSAPRTGASAVTGTSDTTGAFSIVLQRENKNGTHRARGDVTVSGRLGFKTLLRHRLARVEVRHGRDLVRAYDLQYEEGDLDRSLLSRIAVSGRGGAYFYDHRFTYTRKELDGGALSEMETFSLGGDPEPLTHSTSSGTTYTGNFGFTVPLIGGSQKLSGSSGERRTRTRALLIDLNGDGRPDRLDGTQNAFFNHGRGHDMAQTAPVGDPAAGSPVTVGLGTLGTDFAETWDYTLNTGAVGVGYSIGRSEEASQSTSELRDIDGDGLVDEAFFNRTLFQQDRLGSASLDRISFAPTYAVAPAAELDRILAEDPELEERRSRIEAAIRPISPLIEWTPPYTGSVKISGALAYSNTPPPDGDGVVLRLYQGENPDAGATWVKSATDTSTTPVELENLDVQAGQPLYFVLSSLDDVPIEEVDGGVRALEEIQFLPAIQYSRVDGTALSESDRSMTDATGAKLFTFDLGTDWRLAGQPFGIVSAQVEGKIVFSGHITKHASADGLRLCALFVPPGEAPTGEERCDVQRDDEVQPFFREFAFDQTTNAESFEFDADVSRGGQLLVLVDSDLSWDPDALTWDISGTMTEVCFGGKCRAPSDDEKVRLTTRVEPAVRIHGHQAGALRPFIVPHAGRLTISSVAPAGGVEPVVFSVRSRNGIVLKHGHGESREVTLQVSGGEQLWFEAHSERETSTGWSITASYPPIRRPGPLGEDEFEYEIYTPDRHQTYDLPATGYGYLSPGASPFSGGYQRFRFGAWRGRANEKFDATLFRPLTEEDLEWLGGPEEPADPLDDGSKPPRLPPVLGNRNSLERKRLELVSPLMPRSHGTLHRGTPGLHPQPAWVSPELTAYIARDGAQHASRAPRYSMSPVGSDSAARGLMPGTGGTHRQSLTTTWHGGLSAGYGPFSLNVGLSAGTTEQKVDLQDVNGDGLADVVIGQKDGSAKARLGKLASADTGVEIDIPAGRRIQSEFQASLGVGPQFNFTHSPSGRPEGGGVSGGFGIGFGVAAGAGATHQALVDVNADGLPDAVRYDGSVMKVRLNFGSRFAEEEDTLPLPQWGDTHTLQVLTNLAGGILNQDLKTHLACSAIPDEKDRDECHGKTAIHLAIDAIVAPNALRRNYTFSLNASASAEVIGNGGGMSISTSITDTPVSLVDVTGDGLPDYVRRLRGDLTMQVMVNNGFGFNPPESWGPPAWVAVPLPSFVVDLGDDVKFGVSNEFAEGLLGGNPFEAVFDTVESSGSHTRQPNYYLSTNLPIPIIPGILHAEIGAIESVIQEQASGFELGFMDIDGDGYQDHVLKTYGDAKPTIAARMNTLAGGNLLETIQRPQGGRIVLSYSQAGNTVGLPQARFTMTRVFVDSGFAPEKEPTSPSRPAGEACAPLEGNGRTFTTTYEYTDGLYQRQEREFFGFRTVRRINPDGSSVEQLFAQDSYETRGLLESATVKDRCDSLLTRTQYLYAPVRQAAALSGTDAYKACVKLTPFFLNHANYCQSRFVPLASVIVEHHEPGSDAFATSWQSFDYDAFGNVKTFRDYADGTPERPGPDAYRAAVTYEGKDTAFSTLFSVARPDTIVIHSGTAEGQGELLRERTADYDARGNLETLKERLDGSAWAESSLTWTAHGVLKSFTGPPNGSGNGLAQGVIYDEFDATGTYPTKTSDLFDLSSKATYDVALGVPLTVTDVAGNPVTRKYDPFGRLIEVWSPVETDGAAVLALEFAYRANTEAALPWALTRHRAPRKAAAAQAPVPLTTVVFADGLQRVIQTKKDARVENMGLGAVQSGPVGYDALGRVASQSQPCFKTAKPAIDATAFDECDERHPTFTVYDAQVEPGKLRSRDGKWQYRGKPDDLAGHTPSDSPHIHIERLNPKTGEVLENWHLRW